MRINTVINLENLFYLDLVGAAAYKSGKKTCRKNKSANVHKKKYC